MADAGEATWSAVVKSGSEHGYGTSNADVKAYAEAGGSAAATAACAATVYGAVVAAGCGVIGGFIGGAIADIGTAIFGSDAPNIDDTWNPILDKIMHRLSDANPGVPWERIKQTFATAVNNATMARRVEWSKTGKAEQKRAASIMGTRPWVYLIGPNTGYIDEGTQEYFWQNVMKGASKIGDIASIHEDVVKGAANAAVALAPKQSPKPKPASPLGWILGGLAVVIAGVAAWKYSENKKKKLAA